jgi:hypothetical protein
MANLGARLAAAGESWVSTIANRVAGYFLNLGFYSGQIEFGTGLQRKRVMWLIVAYLFLFLGLFSHQCIDTKRSPIEFAVNNVKWAVLAASAVVAIALFPFFTQWFNRDRKKPSWEQVLWAFSFGFFVDLSSTFLSKAFH